MGTKISTQLQQMYELPGEIMSLIESDDVEAEQIVAELATRLSDLAPAIRNYLQYLDDHAAAMDNRAAVFADESRKAKQFSAMIKDGVKAAMVDSGMMDIAPFKVTNAAPALEIAPDAKPPAKFCDIIPKSLKLRTNDLKAALKDGQKIKGYSLRPVYVLRVKP